MLAIEVSLNGSIFVNDFAPFSYLTPLPWLFLFDVCKKAGSVRGSTPVNYMLPGALVDLVSGESLF